MASNEKRVSKYDFRVFSEVPYVMDANLKPDTFFEDLAGVFHIGFGTDLQRRLFELSLTPRDVKFLKGLKIDPMR